MLEDDGVWFFPLRNERYNDGKKLKSTVNDCRKPSEGILGGTMDDRTNAIEECKTFFMRVLNFLERI